MNHNELLEYPGGDIIVKGIADLERGEKTKEALLVMIAGRNLERLGIKITPLPDVEPYYEHRLYEMLEEEDRASAHGAYNALIGRIVSFDNAYSAHLARQKG